MSDDAAVHQAYTQATSGSAGAKDGDEEQPEAVDAGEGPQSIKVHFEPTPWNITDMKDMQKVLYFSHLEVAVHASAFPATTMQPGTTVEKQMLLWHRHLPLKSGS